MSDFPRFFDAEWEAAGLAERDTVAPAVPGGLGAVPGDEQVILSWGLNTEPDFSHYLLFSGQTQIYSGPNTIYVHSALTNGQTYSYTLYAVDKSNNVSLAAAISATPTAAPTNTEPRIGGILKRPWNDHRIDEDFVLANVTDTDMKLFIERSQARHTAEMGRPGQSTPTATGDAGTAFKSQPVQSLSRAGNSHGFGVMDGFRATHAKIFVDQMYDILKVLWDNLNINDPTRRITIAAKNGYPQTTYRLFRTHANVTPWDWKEYSMCMAFIYAFVRVLRVNKHLDSRYGPMVANWDEFWLIDHEQRWKHGLNRTYYAGINDNTKTSWFPVDNITHPHTLCGVALWYRHLDAVDNPGIKISNESPARLLSISLGCLENVYKSCFENRSKARTIDGVAYPAFDALVFPHSPMQPGDKGVYGQVGLYPHMTMTGLNEAIKEGIKPEWFNRDFGKLLYAATAFVICEKGSHWCNNPTNRDANNPVSKYELTAHGKWKSMWGSDKEDAHADDGKGVGMQNLNDRQKGRTAPNWPCVRLWDGATKNAENEPFEGGEVHDWNGNGNPVNRWDSNWDSGNPEFGSGTFATHLPFPCDTPPASLKASYWYKKFRNQTGLQQQIGGLLLAASQVTLGWDADTGAVA